MPLRASATKIKSYFPNEAMNSENQAKHKCVLSGEEVIRLGSNEQAKLRKVDGVSTEIGVVSTNQLHKYHEVLAGHREVSFRTGVKNPQIDMREHRKVIASKLGIVKH